MKLWSRACSVCLVIGTVTGSAACTTLDVLGERPVEGDGDTVAVTGDGDGDGDGDSSGDGDGDSSDDTSDDSDGQDHPNILDERQGIPLTEVSARLNAAFQQLFFGDPESEAVFFDQGDGTGFMQDVANGDVRTDAMAYGMLVTVQLDQREVYDKVWAWAKEYMLVKEGPSEGLLLWRCNLEGDECNSSAATDASSIIVTTLFMAQSRWGDFGGHEYQKDAMDLLDAMTETEERNGGILEEAMNCFDLEAGLPRAGSVGPEGQVPVDYLMPAYYKLWSQIDLERAPLWVKMADNSRALLHDVAHEETGLLPEIVTYDGEPIADHDYYAVRTMRTHLNLALDHLWYGPHDWIVEQNERRLDFFLSEGVDNYVVTYELNGEKVKSYNTIAHIASVAVSAGTSSRSRHDVFLEDLLNQPIPSGEYRYYDGMLYMLSLLYLSGQITNH